MPSTRNLKTSFPIALGFVLVLLSTGCADGKNTEGLIFTDDLETTYQMPTYPSPVMNNLKTRGFQSQTPCIIKLQPKIKKINGTWQPITNTTQNKLYEVDLLKRVPPPNPNNLQSEKLDLSNTENLLMLLSALDSKGAGPLVKKYLTSPQEQKNLTDYKFGNSLFTLIVELSYNLTQQINTPSQKGIKNLKEINAEFISKLLENNIEINDDTNETITDFYHATSKFYQELPKHFGKTGAEHLKPYLEAFLGNSYLLKNYYTIHNATKAYQTITSLSDELLEKASCLNRTKEQLDIKKYKAFLDPVLAPWMFEIHYGIPQKITKSYFDRMALATDKKFLDMLEVFEQSCRDHLDEFIKELEKTPSGFSV